MALQRFTYFNTDIITEQQADDELSLGKLSLLGVSGVAIDAGGNVITGVATPINATDAVNKSYADAARQGTTWKRSARAMSDINIASLTGTQTIDGVVTNVNDIVLLTGQTNPIENGLYLVKAGSWQRTDDMANGAHAAGAAVFVTEGTNYHDLGFISLADEAADTVGTSPLPWTQFTGLGEVTPGAGLSKIGNMLNLLLENNSGLSLATGKLTVGTSTTIGSDSNGLNVLGLPLNFAVGGNAVSNNVTSPNLNTLTGGVSVVADALHTHTTVIGAQAIVSKLQNGTTALVAGDPVVWSTSADTLGKADASNDTLVRVVGIAAGAIGASATGNIVRQGVATNVLTGATPGTPYFLSVGGGISSSRPASGNYLVRLGIAKNATDLDVRIEVVGKR